MSRGLWDWNETNWVANDFDWKSSDSIKAGIDIGTTSTQAVIIADENLCGYSNIHTGSNFIGAANMALQIVLDNIGMSMSDINSVGTTGWGNKKVEYSNGFFDEISAHAKGARYMFGPEVHTVVDLGGQTIKAIRLYDWDAVWDFVMNDKCATGFGRNMEFICDLLDVSLEEIGELSLDVDIEPEPIATSCYCFADTETMGLFGRPEYKSAPIAENEIYAKHLFAIAWRILGTIGKLQPLDVGEIKIHYPKLAFTGGLAKNIGITKRIERELDMEAMKCDYDPMIAGAIGAALLV